MTIRDLRNLFLEKLQTLYPERETEVIFFYVLEHFLGFTRTGMNTRKEEVPEEKIRQKILWTLSELEKHKPIQYILGETEFYGLKLKVNEHVLIPRQETEELVRWILEDHKNSSKKFSILDVGTGSGCIALAIKKYLKNPEITGIDFSPKALETASLNSIQNDLNVEFVEYDILKQTTSIQNKKFDVIVSNPPYIPLMEKESMHPNVLQYEPHSALFVEDRDPLIFYKQIALFAKNNLHSGGLLYFEIHENQGQKIIGLLKENRFSEIELKKDLNEKSRMIKCRYIA